MGIEPTQSAWKAEILAIELHPQVCSYLIILVQRLSYYTKVKRNCQEFHEIFYFLFKFDIKRDRLPGPFSNFKIIQRRLLLP